MSYNRDSNQKRFVTVEGDKNPDQQIRWNNSMSCLLRPCFFFSLFLELIREIAPVNFSRRGQQPCWEFVSIHLFSFQSDPWPGQVQVQELCWVQRMLWHRLPARRVFFRSCRKIDEAECYDALWIITKNMVIHEWEKTWIWNVKPPSNNIF